MEGKKISRLSPAAIISTFFGIGKFPVMPGTLGSYVAIILAAAIFYQPHLINIEGIEYVDMGAVVINPNYIIYVLALLSSIFYVVGVWASEKYSKGIGVKDPGSVIIDEVAGIFTASALIAFGYALLLTFFQNEYIIYLTLSPFFFFAIFILFRIFDMIKPWHIGRADRKYEGGFGIMIDDIIAAFYTAIAFYIIFFALKFTGTLDKFTEVGSLEELTKLIMNFLLWPFNLLLII